MAKLYIVGTPIGNLGDISQRAVKTLSEVDFICAEDTRVTVKLLNHLGIKKPMVSCHEHNIAERSEQIIARIAAGESCAIVTDAGMPCISDPGELLVALCHSHGVQTEVVPGPSAVIAAVALSGLATSRFTFEGFLSVNKSSRAEHLASLREERRTMVFYEAPHKLLRTLEDMAAVFGEQREIALCRELTKLHEQTIRTTLGKAVERYTQAPPKGEFVLVISGAVPGETPALTFEQASGMVRSLIADGQSPTMAAKAVAKDTGYKKADLYRSVLDEE